MKENIIDFINRRLAEKPRRIHPPDSLFLASNEDETRTQMFCLASFLSRSEMEGIQRDIPDINSWTLEKEVLSEFDIEKHMASK